MITRDAITAELAARLVAQQFPAWAGLPVVPVAESGWDNRTFRLGDTMTVRLPTAEYYVAAVEKEHTWLPRLAPHLPLPIPTPLALGTPGLGYPWPWSVRRWIDGRPATEERIADLVELADDLARFLVALWAADVPGGPAAGAHSFHRGGNLVVYDRETQAALARLGGRVDAATATTLWEEALAAHPPRAPVWFHGDVAAGNLLVDDDGRLSAVIDFGTSGVGDSACDLVIAWTLFDAPSREAFRGGTALDEGAWARAAGWALWKALITLAAPAAAQIDREGAERTLHRVLDDRGAAPRRQITR
ncbi:MAG: aminoglycoside phosphotransferase family protein [Pseudonocardiales bacterium]|nr:aminoglycoside phosphotransferase family protein [Pseudonocardiales bacterium]